jgi:hypothetical protein
MDSQKIINRLHFMEVQLDLLKDECIKLRKELGKAPSPPLTSSSKKIQRYKATSAKILANREAVMFKKPKEK